MLRARPGYRFLQKVCRSALINCEGAVGLTDSRIQFALFLLMSTTTNPKKPPRQRSLRVPGPRSLPLLRNLLESFVSSKIHLLDLSTTGFHHTVNKLIKHLYNRAFSITALIRTCRHLPMFPLDFPPRKLLVGIIPTVTSHHYSFTLLPAPPLPSMES